MQLTYSFTVPVPVAQAWSVLLDVERVAPCIPGATLTSFSGDEFAGNVQVKVGPVNLTYQGKGRFVERDEEQRRVVMQASGRDRRGNGTAAGTVTATLRATDGDPGATEVSMVADLAVTGRPAQFGRGMITDVGGKLVGQFATCLASRLAEGQAAAPEPAGAPGSIVEAATAAPPSPATSVGEPAPAVTGVEPSPAAAPEPAPTLGAAAPATSVAPATPVEPVAPATVAAPASGSSVDSVTRRAPEPAPPVDLLAVGAGPLLRRVMPYVIGFVLGALVMWVVLRRT
jgi:carbon monoxide dehydrogenase subunit G